MNEVKHPWYLDDDGWFCRQAVANDYALDFTNSDHAFIEHDILYCRDAAQADELDEGRVPK